MDLAFAISTTSRLAQNNFHLIKDAVKHMIDVYGVGRVRYGVITFGSSATIRIPFTDAIQDPTDLKNSVASLPRMGGSPALDEALQKAETLFKGSTREKAKKILVVVIDRSSSSTTSNVKVAF